MLDSEERAWHLLGCLTVLSGGTLALVAIDKPFRGDNDETDKQVLPGPPTHTVAAEATVRCESATSSTICGVERETSSAIYDSAVVFVAMRAPVDTELQADAVAVNRSVMWR